MNKGLLIFMFILCLNIASASLLDTKSTIEVKDKLQIGDKLLEKNPIWDTYAPVEIKSWEWFGLTEGKVKWSGAIEKHTSICSDNCEDIIDIYSDGTSPLIDDFRAYRIFDNGDWILSNLRSYNLQLQSDVPDYEIQCHEDANKENKSIITNCNKVQIGSHKGWVDYKIGDIVPEGNYVLRLTGEKRAEWIYDWQIQTQGKWITEWSTWGAQGSGSSYVIINSPANNSFQLSNPITINITANVTGAYLVNISLYDNSTGSWGLRNTTNITGIAGNHTYANVTTDSSWSSNSQTGRYGNIITVGTSDVWINRINCSNVASGASTAYVCSGEIGTTCAETYVTASCGSAFSSPFKLNASTTYKIVADKGGASYSRGYKTASIHGSTNGFSWTSNEGGDTGEFGQTWAIEMASNQSIFRNSTQVFSNNYNFGTYLIGAKACDSDGVCGLSNNITLNKYVQTYNSSSFETATETFTLNQTGATSVAFWFNGTKYDETILNGISSKTLNMPSTPGNYTFFWSFNNGLYNSTANNISVNALNFTICGAAPQNNSYLNITFRNETIGNQSVTAQAQVSFNYWLGTGTYYKTYTFTNTSENSAYTFCANNASLIIKGNESVVYSNSISPQRNYINSNITLSSSLTTQTLYLLPSSDGYYVTFQVVTSSRQTIPGAVVRISRSGYGIVESRSTDDSGVATFFMNPNIAYTVTTSYSGYDDVSSVITPTQTTYTITLGSSGGVSVTDYSRGVMAQILPRGRTLTQNTNYNFNITFTSDYYSLTQYGILISNENGVLYANVSGNNAAGGVVNTLLNTGTNKSFFVKGYYTVNGTTIYIGSTGFAIWTNDTGYSIGAFLQRLSGYLDNENDTNGLYGLTKNSSNGGYSVSLSILIFILIFMTMGIVGYQYGINQQFLILGIATFISYLLEVAYPIIDLVRDQSGSTLTQLPFLTFFLALATVAMGIWEGSH